MVVDVAVLAEPSVAAVAPDPVVRGRRSRTVVAASALVASVVGLVVGAPALVLCGVVLSVASVLRRRVSWDLALPLAVTTCVAVSAAVGSAGHALGAGPLSWHPAAVVVVGSLLAALDSRRGTNADSPSVAVSWPMRIVYAPAAVALVAAAVQVLAPRAAASWLFYGTDSTRHLALVDQIRASGQLDYSLNAYPGALHGLLAWVSAPSAPDGGPAALLAYDVRLLGAVTWLSLAVLLSTVATLTLRLGSVLGCSRKVTTCAALAASTFPLAVNGFAITFLYMTAAPSLVAVVALSCLALAATERPDVRSGRLLPYLALTCLVTVAVAHLWQALVIVPAACWLAVVLGRPRELVADLRSLRGRRLAGAAAVVATGALVTAPALIGVAHAGGITIASIVGTVPAPPSSALVVCAVALVWAVRARAHDGVRALLGSALGLLLVAGVLLYGSGHLDVTQYYVMKAGWFLVLLTLPLIALVTLRVLGAGAYRLWAGAARLGRAARVVRVAIVGIGIALVVGFVIPLPAVEGLRSYDTVHDLDGRGDSARLYDIAVDYGTRFQPAVTVPIEVGKGIFANPFVTRVASSIISVETGQPEQVGPPFAVCAAVRTVAGTHPAVIVTSLDPAVLEPFMEVGGCTGVPVVRIDGPPRILQDLPTAHSTAHDEPR